MTVASLGGDRKKISSGWKLAWRESIDDYPMFTHLDASVAGYLSRRHDNERGTATASYAQIGKAVGCSPRGAMNSVWRLLKWGALKLERRGNSLRQANEYSLHKLVNELVNEKTRTSERNDQQLVNETTTLSVGKSSTDLSLRKVSGMSEEERARLLAKHSRRIEARP